MPRFMACPSLARVISRKRHKAGLGNSGCVCRRGIVKKALSRVRPVRQDWWHGPLYQRHAVWLWRALDLKVSCSVFSFR